MATTISGMTGLKANRGAVKAWWCALVLALATGCATGCAGAKAESAKAPSSRAETGTTAVVAETGGAEPASAPPSGFQSAEAAAPVSGTMRGGVVPPSAPAAEKSAAPSRAERGGDAQPAPEDRPGLGTEWGETRFSRVRDVAFNRADEDRPFAVTALHYNDRAGVDALAREASARASARLREVPTGDGAVTLSIRGADGEPLEAIHVGDRTFVVGQEGERYTITLTNHTRHRFEAVTTVDGLDVINGKPGSMRNRGYLLMPFGSVEIDGFRRSQDAVAAFRFASVRDAYAAQRGMARNVGVIGVALFGERGDRRTQAEGDDMRMRDTASPFPADPRFAPAPRR